MKQQSIHMDSFLLHAALSTVQRGQSLKPGSHLSTQELIVAGASLVVSNDEMIQRMVGSFKTLGYAPAEIVRIEDQVSVMKETVIMHDPLAWDGTMIKMTLFDQMDIFSRAEDRFVDLLRIAKGSKQRDLVAYCFRRASDCRSGKITTQRLWEIVPASHLLVASARSPFNP